jgi:iron complex outermembrane receptor protein
MNSKLRDALVGAVVASLLLCAATPSRAQTATDFTVPSEPLADALRAIASQTNTNILFDRRMVAGRSATALKARLSLDDALKEVLSGTGLTYRNSDDRTIIIVPLHPPGASSPATTSLEEAFGTSPPADSQNRPWLRLASAEQTVARPSSSNDAPLLASKRSGGTPENPQATTLQEIVVSAQKRSENAQTVPISIQVVNAQALANQNQDSFESLSQTLPGVNIAASGWADSLYIRGVGSGVNSTNFDQSVATFDDDIYHGRSKTSGATFLDLDRIEVLKGPQSTFFGNNAVAGALNIVTKKPGDRFEASARLLYGMYGQYAAEAAVTLPLSEQLSVRLAGILDGERGWIKNVDTGEEAPNESNRAGRVTVLYKPTNDFDATLKFEESNDRTTGTPFGEPQQFVNCPPAAPLTPSFSGQCAQALAQHLPLGLHNDENSGLPGQGNWLFAADDVLTLNYRQWGHTFTSVTGYSYYDDNMNWDVYNLATPAFAANQVEHYHQWSQELRVASPTDQPFQYLFGAYYQSDQLSSHQGAVLSFLDPVIAAVPPLASLAPYEPINLDINYPQDEKVYSVFGSLGYKVTDALKLTAGVRGSEAKLNALLSNAFLGNATHTFSGGTPLPAAQEALMGAVVFPVGMSPPLARTDKNWMPSAGIQYQIDQNAMVYFSYNKGFKAGGFNEGGALPPSQPIPFGPEYVNAYEVGLKSEWLDRRLLFNFDVFRSDYRDLQVVANYVNPTLHAQETVDQNAANSRSEGAELETQWLISNDFRLGANITYLESYYASYPRATQVTLQSFCSQNYVLPYCSIYSTPVQQFTDRSGETTPFAPRWSGNLVASYSVALPGSLKLTTEVDPYFSSSYNNQDPYILGTSAYVRLDARVSLTSPDGHWTVDLIGKNLTNRIIVISLPGIDNASSAQKEKPANIAAQIRWRW